MVGDILMELNGRPVKFMERIQFLKVLTVRPLTLTFVRMLKKGVSKPDDPNVNIIAEDYVEPKLNELFQKESVYGHAYGQPGYSV